METKAAFSQMIVLFLEVKYFARLNKGCSGACIVRSVITEF